MYADLPPRVRSRLPTSIVWLLLDLGQNRLLAAMVDPSRPFDTVTQPLKDALAVYVAFTFAIPITNTSKPITPSRGRRLSELKEGEARRDVFLRGVVLSRLGEVGAAVE